MSTLYNLIESIGWETWSLIRKGVGAMLCLWAAGVVVYYLRNPFRSPLPERYYVLPALLILMILRLPVLAVGMLDIDESMYIAGANKLWVDPRFWVTHDGSTSGPGVIYPLVWLRFLSGHLDYGTVRTYALFFNLIPAILLFYAALRRVVGVAAAQLGLLPVLLTISLSNHVSFLAYNSEQICLPLLAAGLFLAVSAYQKKYPASWLFGLGLVLGTAPFTKLQVVPMAAWLGLWTLVMLISGAYTNKQKKVFVLLTGALTPALLVIAYLLYNDFLKPFWLLYIQSNLQYTETQVNMRQLDPLRHLYQWLFWLFTSRDTFGSMLLMVAEVVLLIGIVFSGRLRLPRLVLLSAGWLLAAFISVYLPKNFFFHYAWFLVFPIALITALLVRLIQENQSMRGVFTSLQVSTLGLIFVLYILKDPFGSAALLNEKYRRQQSPLATYLQQVVRPGERVGSWGFFADEFVTLNILSTNLQVHTHMVVQRKGEVRKYLIERYIRDMETYRPRYLVDNVHPDNGLELMKDPKTEGLYSIAPIADYIGKHYTLVRVINGNRVYQRVNDQLAEMTFSGQR